MIQKLIFSLFALTTLFFMGCGAAGGNDPGTEYVPDMVHGIAYEANLSDAYYKNTWGTDQEYYDLAKPRLPVKGTIPRGYIGTNSHDGIQVTLNGYVPFYYGDSEDERLRASEDILNNPFPITKKGLSQGKELYEISCAICHGKKLDGDGFLVSDDNPNVKYPAQPANFLMDKFIDKSNGFYYFAIMKGKNVMGSYADKLSYKERWDVIHYIRSVQAKKKGLKYNENENTFSEYAWAVNDSKHGVSHEGNASHGGMHVSATLTQHGSQVIDGHNTAAIKTVEGQTTEHKKDGWIKRTIKKGKEKVSDFKEKRAAKKAAKGNH